MNGYVAYIVVMAVIIALMMTAIGSINFVLRTARRFYYGDWKYRCKVLLIVIVLGVLCGAFAANCIYHIINDPPE
jgi:phage-related holin